ncbi:MAG: HlyD family secretion protein [Arcobacter sp.]|nr:MAG: HlyD family secretion protein [Arcobacter sp.]
MKKIISFLVVCSSFVMASEYYSKLNPINTYQVKSAVSGQVIFVNKKIESQKAKNSIIVKINDKVNVEDLKQSKIKLKNLNEILKIEQGTLKSFERVSSKSRFDKDNQKIKIFTIASNISDLKTKIATLEDTISNKTLIEKDNYIYNIAVEVGDYVNPGTLLYSSMDLSAGKLIVYLPINQANTIGNKTIYLNGKKTELKISKLYKVADTTHISSYKCEIIVPSPPSFSNLVKIEFK